MSEDVDEGTITHKVLRRMTRVVCAQTTSNFGSLPLEPVRRHEPKLVATFTAKTVEGNLLAVIIQALHDSELAEVVFTSRYYRQHHDALAVDSLSASNLLTGQLDSSSMSLIIIAQFLSEGLEQPARRPSTLASLNRGPHPTKTKTAIGCWISPSKEGPTTKNRVDWLYHELSTKTRAVGGRHRSAPPRPRYDEDRQPRQLLVYFFGTSAARGRTLSS